MESTEKNKGVMILDTLYERCLNGVPKVSKPVEELAKDYTKKYGYTDKAIDKLIQNQLSKNTLNGFVTSFGGFITMPVTLPENITSVLYGEKSNDRCLETSRSPDSKQSHFECCEQDSR